jgi:uncharacterized protein (TIGR02246 family)
VTEDPGASGGMPTSERRRIEEELRHLSTEYAAAADERDGRRFAGVFTPDGELVVLRPQDRHRPVSTRSGRDQLAESTDALSRYARTFHQISNHRYRIGDGEAWGEVLCTAHHALATPGGSEAGAATGTDVVWVIRYRDTYRDTGPAWRIARRELHLQWIEERPIVAPGIVSDDPSPF